MLEALGVAVEVRPASVDESALEGESPSDYVARLARSKADAVARPGEAVLAADTIVVLDGELLGKPSDRDDARRMLRALSGRTHEVLSGIHLSVDARRRGSVETTRVSFAELSEAEIGWYVDSGEPDDKAGAYAVQGGAALFIERIEGSWSNVVGLPLRALYRLGREVGLDLLALARL